MEQGFIIALLIAIPIIIFPVALGWFFNLGQIVDSLKAKWSRPHNTSRS